MRKYVAILLCVLGIAGISLDAMARGAGGGGGMGLGGGFSGSAGRSMVNSPSASSHALPNANAPWTGSQERGLDRSRERMSDEGISHQKATSHPLRRNQETVTHARRDGLVR